MRRSIAAIAAIASLLGSASITFAQGQSNSPSPAALLGVQERSIKTQNVPSSQANTQLGNEVYKNNDPLVLYRLDSKTRVILGPVYKSTDPAEIPVAGSTGDNRVQLMHDLDDQ